MRELHSLIHRLPLAPFYNSHHRQKMPILDIDSIRFEDAYLELCSQLGKLRGDRPMGKCIDPRTHFYPEQFPDADKKPWWFSVHDSVLDGCPSLTGKSSEVGAAHEIHLFLSLDGQHATVNAHFPEETMRMYKKAVKIFNRTMVDAYPFFRFMGSPELAINYDVGVVRIMQISMYVYSDSMLEVLRYTLKLAQAFTRAGFDIYRIKNEAMILGCRGMPESDEEMRTQKKRYTEFHMRVCRKNGDLVTPLSSEELALLQRCADRLTELCGSRVALSYNEAQEDAKISAALALKEDAEGETSSKIQKQNQRYFNFRFDGIGITTAMERLSHVEGWIAEATDGHFEVKKTHYELAWHDTGRTFDQGWIGERTIPLEEWTAFYLAGCFVDPGTYIVAHSKDSESLPIFVLTDPGAVMDWRAHNPVGGVD